MHSLLAGPPHDTSFAHRTGAVRRLSAVTRVPRLRPNRMRARVAFFGALSLAPALALPVCARAQASGIGPVVLQLPASARAIGFANAYVAVREAEAVFYNPAQLGVRPGVAMSLGRYRSAATAGAVAATHVFGPIGFGVGVQFLDFDAQAPVYPALAPNGEELLTGGPFPASSLVAAIAFEMAFKGIRWGVAGKFAEDRALGVRDGVLLGDVGAAKEIGIGTAGISVQNLGTSARVAGTAAALPTRATLGYSAAGPLGPLDAVASAAVSVRRGGRVSPAGGLEVGYMPIDGVSFAGRIGGRVPEKNAGSPLTLGASFTFDRLSVDYGFEPMQGEGSGHRFGLRIR
jgi:hypothetical protein